MSESPERTALYRIYGDEDLLLYIGVARDFGLRWKTHARMRPWWDEHRRQTVTWYESRDDAEAAEVAAIKAELPKYNVAHTGSSSEVQISVAVERAAARKIKELRQAAGWSQGELARRMITRGWPWYQQTVARIEDERRQVRLGELADLGILFGVTPQFFFTDGDTAGPAARRDALERAVREQVAAEILARLTPPTLAVAADDEVVTQRGAA